MHITKFLAVHSPGKYANNQESIWISGEYESWTHRGVSTPDFGSHFPLTKCSTGRPQITRELQTYHSLMKYCTSKRVLIKSFKTNNHIHGTKTLTFSFQRLAYIFKQLAKVKANYESLDMHASACTVNPTHISVSSFEQSPVNRSVSFLVFTRTYLCVARPHWETAVTLNVS